MKIKKNKIKIKKVKKGAVSPIPPFKTLEEEANYWDTHSVTDDINDGALVGFHSANKNRTLTIRFSDKALRSLREHAFKLGIGPTTLARMWLMEKLSHL